MAIELPDLPYPTDALEPYMSQRTLEFHYGKHHKGYINKLNSLIKDTPFGSQDLKQMMTSALETKQTKIYNNAAQAWNHTFFWNCMTPQEKEPSSGFKALSEKYFGSFDNFKSVFDTEAAQLFGSGWTWLVKDNSGQIKVRPMGNAGNPLAEFGETPLLTCDVWEHAYYLDYQNDRPKFISNFWHLVNWDFVERNME